MYPLQTLCSSGSTILHLPRHLRPLLASRMPAAAVHGSLRAVAPKLLHEKLVVVGDYSAQALLSAGVKPWTVVFDCVVERRDTSCPLLSMLKGYRIVSVENRRSTISCTAALAVCEAVRSGYTAVKVYGEEDLLALPAILCSDLGMTIVYGLPHRGAIVARVTVAAKTLTANILKEFNVSLQERGV